jgi:hypothetical protein
MFSIKSKSFRLASAALIATASVSTPSAAFDRLDASEGEWTEFCRERSKNETEFLRCLWGFDVGDPGSRFQ